MKKISSRIILLMVVISSASYLVFIFLRHYNSPDNIEKRCILKFQKDFKKSDKKSDEEWGLIMDIANDNYFKCMKIP